jgi:hypothetical protein
MLDDEVNTYKAWGWKINERGLPRPTGTRAKPAHVIAAFWPTARLWPPPVGRSPTSFALRVPPGGRHSPTLPSNSKC